MEHRLEPEAAERGLIVDRNGAVLAANRPSLSLMAVNNHGCDIASDIEQLGEHLCWNQERSRRLLSDLQRAPHGARICVVQDLPWSEQAGLENLMQRARSLHTALEYTRVYPYGDACASLVGSVTLLGEGETGSERVFDSVLRGRPGVRIVQASPLEQELRASDGAELPAWDGLEIQLTIDADLQAWTFDLLSEDGGSAAVLDCQSGEVLCLSQCGAGGALELAIAAMRSGSGSQSAPAPHLVMAVGGARATESSLLDVQLRESELERLQAAFLATAVPIPVAGALLKGATLASGRRGRPQMFAGLAPPDAPHYAIGVAVGDKAGPEAAARAGQILRRILEWEPATGTT